MYVLVLMCVYVRLCTSPLHGSNLEPCNPPRNRVSINAASLLLCKRFKRIRYRPSNMSMKSKFWHLFHVVEIYLFNLWWSKRSVLMTFHYGWQFSDWCIQNGSKESELIGSASEYGLIPISLNIGVFSSTTSSRHNFFCKYFQ